MSQTATDDEFRFAAGDQVQCPVCNEQVRAGSVRCWNCGGFMKPEVEAHYEKMRQEPPEVLYSEPTAASEAVFESTTGDDEGVDDDDGFRLNLKAGAGLPEADSAATDDLGDAVAAGPEESDEGPASADGQYPELDKKEGEDDDGLMASIAADLDEQRQRKSGRRGPEFAGGVRTTGGFVIYCPYGCTIEVKDDHRGRSGRCPKCRAPFFVPVDPPNYVEKKKQAAASESIKGAGATGDYQFWLENQKLHTVSPEKLKLVAGSLVKDFSAVDVAISAERIVLLPLTGKGGLFGGGPKPDEIRAKAKELAASGAAPAQWASDGAEVREITADEVMTLRVVQPSTSRDTSMFAGVPVFGDGMVVIQLPHPGNEQPIYLSLGLTAFRKLSDAISSLFGRSEFGAVEGVPLADETFEHTCHYTDVPIKALKNLAYYEADPESELVVAGYKCGACGLTVSEDGRAKEGLGGKNGKGIAKAKCPKCSEKMGSNLLHTLVSLVATPDLEESKS